jgi:hypothetical protein
MELKGSTDAAAESLSLTITGPNGNSGTYKVYVVRIFRTLGVDF